LLIIANSWICSTRLRWASSRLPASTRWSWIPRWPSRL
jgi:hypothetical protein